MKEIVEMSKCQQHNSKSTCLVWLFNLQPLRYFSSKYKMSASELTYPLPASRANNMFYMTHSLQNMRGIRSNMTLNVRTLITFTQTQGNN